MLKNLKWGEQLVYKLNSEGKRRYPRFDVFEYPYILVTLNDTDDITDTIYGNCGLTDSTSAYPFYKERVNDYTWKFKWVYDVELTTMNRLFLNLSSDTRKRIVSIDMSNINTSNVSTVYHAFSYCSYLESIELFDTSNVDLFTNCFAGCTSLKNVPLLDTSKATRISGMFDGCSSLNTIPLFNTENATQMGIMFRGCSSLTSIPHLWVGNVEDFLGIFTGCSNISYIDLYSIRKSIDISPCNLDRNSILHVFNNLTKVSTSEKITLSKEQNSLLTMQDRYIAINKNFAVVTV